MNEVVIAAIGAIIYGVIREIGGQIVNIKNVSSAQKEAEYAAHEKRMLTYVSEVKKDYEEAKKEAQEAKVRAEEAYTKQVDCEKNGIRMEARIELLTRLSGINISDTKVHQVLESIEREKEQEKKKGS